MRFPKASCLMQQTPPWPLKVAEQIQERKRIVRSNTKGTEHTILASKILHEWEKRANVGNGVANVGDGVATEGKTAGSGQVKPACAGPKKHSSPTARNGKPRKKEDDAKVVHKKTEPSRHQSTSTLYSTTLVVSMEVVSISRSTSIL